MRCIESIGGTMTAKQNMRYIAVDATYPWEEVAVAHRDMEAGAHIGKIVLVVLPDAI